MIKNKAIPIEGKHIWKIKLGTQGGENEQGKLYSERVIVHGVLNKSKFRYY